GGQRDELILPDLKEHRGAIKDGGNAARDDGREGVVDLLLVAGVEHQDLLPTRRSSSRRFGPSSVVKIFTPVALPPGRFRLATRPISPASARLVKPIGRPAVAALAATADGRSVATSTATRRRTSSSASAGS